MVSLEHRRRVASLAEGDDGKDVVIAGWIENQNDKGGIAFVRVRDASGSIQVTIPKKRVPPQATAALLEAARESVVVIEGTVQKSREKAGGYELIPKAAEVITRAEVPLPLGIVDKVDATLGTRLDNRFLDLRKPEIRAIFKVRMVATEAIRQYLYRNHFIEIQTPKVVGAGAEGGATLFHVQYFDREAFLAQSPQLYKQMLMAAGFERVFEIGPAFRAESSDTVRHLSEFTSFDIEMSFIESSEDVMKMLEGIVHAGLDAVARECSADLERMGKTIRVPTLPFPRVAYAEAVELLKAKGTHASLDIEYGTEEEKQVAKMVAEKHGGAELYFLTQFPTAIKRATFYAKRLEANPALTGYFDLEFKGQELTSGGQREHRFEKLMAQMKENNLDPKQFEFYLKAFRYGVPPHGGFGFGVDRFVQSMLDLPNIREAVLFPRDRYRLVP
jgi:nondiscriminating aspartyl-tRNA synthetase